MQKEFVTYVIASKLKELGFDGSCFAIYKSNIDIELAHSINDAYFYNNSNLHSSISAPLWQQVIDWIRERYKINIIFTQSNHNGCWIYTLEGIDDGKDYYDLYRSYEVAREQAILKVIELCKK